jgi:hypothetical protein
MRAALLKMSKSCGPEPRCARRRAAIRMREIRKRCRSTIMPGHVPTLRRECPRMSTDVYECPHFIPGPPFWGHADECLQMLTNVDASPPPPVHAGDGGCALCVGKERVRLEARGPKGGGRKAKKSQGGPWLLRWRGLAFLGFRDRGKPSKANQSQGKPRRPKRKRRPLARPPPFRSIAEEALTARSATSCCCRTSRTRSRRPSRRPSCRA